MVLYSVLQPPQCFGVVSLDGIGDDWRELELARGSRVNKQHEDIRPMTRACRAALLPVCDEPSSFRILFKSLFMRAFERSEIEAAMCCRLDAMVWCVCNQAG